MKRALDEKQPRGPALFVVLAVLCACWYLSAGHNQKECVPGASRTSPPAGVAIVIAVSAAPLDLAECISSLYRNTPEMAHVYVVDDSPTDAEADQVKAITEGMPKLSYLRVPAKQRPMGHTATANAGLRAAHGDGHEVMVMVNSDTVLTPGWLSPLLLALRDPAVGMAGPLSNAASYQSVPIVKENGTWAYNMPLPAGWSHDAMARLVKMCTAGVPALLPVLNGTSLRTRLSRLPEPCIWCCANLRPVANCGTHPPPSCPKTRYAGFLFAIKRVVVDSIGLFDEENFPNGFGEKIDYAFRARAAGFQLHGVTSSYVFHRKSEPHDRAVREQLSKEALRVLDATYGGAIQSAAAALESDPVLAEARRRTQQHLPHMLPAVSAPFTAVFILNAAKPKPFLLGGGAISVVQEALGLAQHGTYVRVAVPAWQVSHFYAAFPQAEEHNLFWGYNDKADNDLAAQELLTSGMLFDFAIATHFLTVPTALLLHERYPATIPAFYVQDIETRFGAHAAVAAGGYRKMNIGFPFAKTQWLVDKLREEFGVRAYKIPPTLDTTRFTAANRSAPNPATALRIAAMVRVATPRRNPSGTLQVLHELKRKHGDGVDITIFGTDPKWVGMYVARENLTTELKAFNNLGLRDRDGVARLMQSTDLFLDAS
jgi:GT2 family glycosyltransferase